MPKYYITELTLFNPDGDLIPKRGVIINTTYPGIIEELTDKLKDRYKLIDYDQAPGFNRKMLNRDYNQYQQKVRLINLQAEDAWVYWWIVQYLGEHGWEPLSSDLHRLKVD